MVIGNPTEKSWFLAVLQQLEHMAFFKSTSSRAMEATSRPSASGYGFFYFMTDLSPSFTYKELEQRSWPRSALLIVLKLVLTDHIIFEGYLFQ